MAAQFCRWDPDLSMVGLRFSNVMLVEDYADFAGYTADQRRFNLWSYIDARDAAQAVELALAYEPHGVEVFVIASPDVVPHVPVEQLLADRFGEVQHTRELGEYESPLSIDKARALLGFDPQHSWRDHASEARLHRGWGVGVGRESWTTSDSAPPASRSRPSASAA